MGQFKNSWRVLANIAGNVLAQIENDAPHAGIVELGARPHKVSAEGVQAIKEWVIAKIGTYDTKEVDSIAWGIMRNLEMYGQKGTFLVQKNLERFAKWTDKEVSRTLQANFNEEVR
jgi:hypothetical protein